MKAQVVSNKITSKSIFLPSFITKLQFTILDVIKKGPKGIKYKLILVPEDYVLGEESADESSMGTIFANYETEVGSHIQDIMNMDDEYLIKMLKKYPHMMFDSLPDENFIMPKGESDALEKT